MRIAVEVGEVELKQMILNRLREATGDLDLSLADVHIEVKSKQNYRSEWEEASFRAKAERIT